MGNLIVVDTDVLIYLLRNNPETVNWFEENKDKYKFATTIINLFELYAGAYKSINTEKEIKDIKALTERFIILDFSIKSAEEAGKQKARLENQGLIIDRGDLFIGVIALTNNFPLKTNNKNHFERISGLKFAE